MINIKLESDSKKSFKQVRSIKTNIHLPPIADIVCENELQQTFWQRQKIEL